MADPARAARLAKRIAT
ncbi:hypothetical protein, partial [Tsukamurella strandjordii]